MPLPSRAGLAHASIAALVACAAPGRVQAATEDCPFGVNAHQASDTAIILAAAVGVGWVRMDLNWTTVESVEGSYDWTTIDRFVDGADKAGLHVFATVGYTPAWAGEAGCDDAAADAHAHCLNSVPDPADWTRFVTAAVGRYGDRVKHWGMWNEPNIHGFFDGTRDQYVDAVLLPGSDAVHDACPDCLVVGPELANLREADWDADEGVCAFGECLFNGWEHSLAAILDRAGPSIDIISHHRYEDDATSFWDGLLDGSWWGDIQYMHGLKEVIDEHGQGQPVWITEFGWQTSPGGDLSETEAADQLTSAWEGFALVQAGTFSATDNDPWPELERMFWYDLHDDPNLYDWGQSTWGLLDGDLVPKEAYAALGDVIRAQGGCVEGDDDPPSDTDVPTEDSGDASGDDGNEDAGDSAADAPRQDSGPSTDDLPSEAPGATSGLGCQSADPLAQAPAAGLALSALAALATLRSSRRARTGLETEPPRSQEARKTA